MSLTGQADADPLAAPASLVPAVLAMGEELAAATAVLGACVELDTLALLGERAATAGLTRHGDRSCGGATRLVRALDGWLAVSLPRPDDLELLPAWLGGDDVDTLLAERPAAALVEAAVELGLAVASLGERTVADGPAIGVDARAERPAPGLLGDVLVADLSSLWAGPLAGHLLTAAGARVVKVESTRRPDGARSGPAAFYDLLHAGQEAAAFDLDDERERAMLRRLVATADVVIEASRPRALRQLGIDAEAAAADGTVWLSITGHGRSGRAGIRVAFGDDAAVAGGLVAGPTERPRFCGDAIADPLAGMVGALAVLECLRQGSGCVLDVAMAGVAAECARLPPPGAAWTGPVAPPRAREPAGIAPALGADTDVIVAELGLG